MAQTLPSASGAPYDANLEQLKNIGRGIVSAITPDAQAADLAGQQYMKRNVPAQTSEQAPLVQAPDAPAATTESSDPQPSGEQYVSQGENQVPQESMVGLTRPSAAGLQKIAEEEKAGAEQIINKADIEKSAIEKKAEIERKQIQDQIQKTEETLAKKEAEVKSFKFDDRSLWDKSSTAQKILLMIGGFLSSASNQGAQAFRQGIENTINRDLAAQNRELDRLKESKTGTESVLGSLRKQLGDKEAASLAYQKLVYDKMAADLQANAAKYRSPIMAEKAMLGAQEASAIAQLKAQELQQKLTQKKSIGAEGQQRLDNAKMALRGVQQMRQALKKGQNTFSLVGDNDFTLGRQAYVEGLGRMQSGGAIGVDEQKRFENFAPGVTDTSSIQMKKLAQAEEELTRRISALEGGEGQDKSYLKAK